MPLWAVGPEPRAEIDRVRLQMSLAEVADSLVELDSNPLVEEALAVGGNRPGFGEPNRALQRGDPPAIWSGVRWLTPGHSSRLERSAVVSFGIMADPIS